MLIITSKQLKKSHFLTFAFILFSLLCVRPGYSSAKSSINYQNNSYGSDTATAIFQGPHSLLLDSTTALVHNYVANMSSLNFSTAADAEIFFNQKTDNLLSYQYNFVSGEVVVQLHLQFANPGWTVANWNQYIYSKLNP